MKRLSQRAVLSFLVSLTLCSFLICVTIMNRMNISKLQMEQLLLEKSLRITQGLSRLLYKTEVLSALILQSGGNIENFEQLAPLIIDDHVILNFLVAPGGVVEKVYPLTYDLTSLIGLDFFGEGTGNPEAIMARDMGTLVLAGPFVPDYGGSMRLAGRLPVFLDAEKEMFWGLVSVTLKFPDALDYAELGSLKTQGYQYALWRISPDTSEKQILDGNWNYTRVNANFVERHIQFFNADWYLRLWSAYTWYSYPENIALIFAGFFISFLVAFVTQNNVDLKQMRNSLEAAKEKAEAVTDTIIAGLNYASKIQKNLLPPESAFKEAFSDYYYMWKPKDIVGGDIYWLKNFDDGTILCVCDCTGHGTPGALLTMLVASTFEAVVTADNHKDTAQIIWELEKRFVTELNVHSTATGSERGLIINDGCDLAVLYIAKDGSVTISSGNTNVFICDGLKVTRLRGQMIRVGDGILQSKEEIKVITIPANPDNKFYIASDGLYEQIGGEEYLPFGYDTLEKIILESHSEQQSVIAKRIWQAFEDYRGDNARRDDFELITFKPRIGQTRQGVDI